MSTSKKPTDYFNEELEETGMFTRFYWLMPVARFAEKYGLDYYSDSINAIEMGRIR